MEQRFAIAALTAIVFLLYKLFEAKFIDKEYKPLKQLVKEVMVVFASTIMASLLYDQMITVMQHSSGGGESVPVFLGEFPAL